MKAGFVMTHTETFHHFANIDWFMLVRGRWDHVAGFRLVRPTNNYDKQ